MKLRVVSVLFLFSVVQLWAAVIPIEEKLKKACVSIDSSSIYFSQAGKLIKSQTDENLFWFYKTIAATNNKQLDSVLIYGKKTILLSKQLRDTTKLLYSYNNIGKTLQHKGKYEQALQYLFTGLRIAEEKKDLIWQGYFGVNIGLNFHDFEDFGKGVRYGKMALNRFNASKDATPFNKILALNTIAINFDDWNKPDSALYYHFKVFDFNSQIDTLSIPFTYNNIGNTLLKQKKFSQSENWLLRATKIADLNARNMNLLDYAYEKAAHYTNLTITAYSQNKLAKARQYLDSTRKYVSMSGSIEKRRDLYQLYTMFYKHVGKYQEAMDFQEKYMSLRDSIFEDERLMAVQETETKYQVEKKEKEIAEQKSTRLMMENELQVRQTWLVVIGVIAAFLVLFVLLIYRQNKIRTMQKEQEFQLREEIFRVEAQNQLQEQRLHISRELHDNIGSQLTFILSSVKNMLFKNAAMDEYLLQQLRNIENFASETLNELRDTIWITGTDVVRFESLKDRFIHYAEKNALVADGLKTEVEIDNNLTSLRLSSIAGINIYRILQEAFTNVFKYADATTFVVKIVEVNQQIILTIEDNGCGFDLENISGGNGLKNMHKRTQLLQGEFTIDTSVNTGTTICISFEKKHLVLEI